MGHVLADRTSSTGAGAGRFTAAARARVTGRAVGSAWSPLR